MALWEHMHYKNASGVDNILLAMAEHIHVHVEVRANNAYQNWSLPMDNKISMNTTQHTQPDVTSQQLKYLLLEGGCLN